MIYSNTVVQIRLYYAIVNKPETRPPDGHPEGAPGVCPWRCSVDNTYIIVISALETALQAQPYIDKGVKYTSHMTFPRPSVFRAIVTS